MTAAGVRWGPVRLVARREVAERLRDRGFLVSTAVLLILVVGLVVVPSLLGRPSAYRVGLVGQAAELRPGLLDAAQPVSMRLDLREVASEQRAVRAVGAGELDAVLLDRTRVVVLDRLPGDLEAVLQQASTADHSRRLLAARGLSAAEIAAVAAPSGLALTSLHPPDREAEAAAAITGVGIFVVFGQLMSTAFSLAAGVVEEKSSRVVEVVLSAIPPWQLLAGKVAGIGLLGAGQLVLFGSGALAAGVAVGAVRPSPAMVGPVLLLMAGFLVGYAFFACLFAAAAATVSRQEELGNVTAPLQLLLSAAFLVSLNAGPGSTLGVIASYVPPTAPLVMPLRLAGGDAGPVAGGLSLLLTVLCAAALVLVAARLYAGAVLRTGARVRLRDAWQGRPGYRSRRGSA